MRTKAPPKKPAKPVYRSIGVNPGTYARLSSYAGDFMLNNTSFVEVLLSKWESMTNEDRVAAISASADRIGRARKVSRQ